MKTIAVASDFSRPAALAVRRAAQLARATGARLELLHVLPPEPLPTSRTAIQDGLGFDAGRVRDEAMARLRQAAERIQAEFAVQVDPHLAEGRAHEEIAARAVAIAADLLVVGAHGEHFVLDVFIGTTAQRVQRLAAVPVLVVRQPPLYAYERVLIATDFSPASRAAAWAARRFFPNAVFHVLHVFEAPFEGRLRYAGVSDAAIDTYRRQAGDQALQELKAFVREAGFGSNAPSVKLEHGYAPARIKEQAAELDADVIVLGTQGKSWLETRFLGSVSEHVAAESSTDVLIVRPPAGA